MKEIQTNGITILLVEVPEGATNFIMDYFYLVCNPYESDKKVIELPQCQWEILGKSTELSEEQMKEICEVLAEFGEAKLYMNYKYKKPLPASFTCSTVQESYLSMLEANGIVDRNNASHPSDLAPTNRWHYEQIKHKWQESQSKVKHYLVLKRI